MDFALNAEQEMLKDAARRFFSKEVDSDYVRRMMKDERGYSEGIWESMAALGWIGLLIPESYQGTGMNFLDMTILLQEMGYACFPGPFFSTAVVGVVILLEGATEAQKGKLLPQIAEGKRILTLAWLEEGGRYSPRGITMKAESRGATYLLSGRKLFVPDATAADLLICAAREVGSPRDTGEGIVLLMVGSGAEGLTVESLETIRGNDLAEVTFDGVEVLGQNRIGEPGEGWRLLDRVLLKAAVAKCSEMIGGGRKVLEMVVEYAGTRHQFGRPIGSFQAIQHHCADILTLLETSTFLTYQAAWRISEGMPHAREAAMAKSWCNDSYRELVGLGHQVMGGIGFMEECDLQLYFRHAQSSALAFGDAALHRERVAQEIGL